MELQSPTGERLYMIAKSTQTPEEIKQESLNRMKDATLSLSGDQYFLKVIQLDYYLLEESVPLYLFFCSVN